MSSKKTPLQRFDATKSELKSLRRRFQLGSWLTVIVGFGLLALVAGYFAYGYSEISDFRNPDLLVSLVGDMVDNGVPQVRQRLQQEVDNNAEVWAEQASQQLVLWMPTLREGLEKYAIQQADLAMDQIDVVGEREFRRLLDENRETVKRAIQDLKDDKEVSDGVVILLEEAIQKELQMSMETQAAALLQIVKDLNKNMKEIHKNENLTPEQNAERRVLTLAKRLQQERFGDVRLEEISSPVLTGIVEEMEQARLDKEASGASSDDGDPMAAGSEQPPVAETPDDASAEASDEAKSDAAKPQDDKPKSDAEPKAESKADGPKDDVAAAKDEPPKAEEKPDADKPEGDEEK